jgi:LPXTG-motif cell wall-anchored protein
MHRYAPLALLSFVLAAHPATARAHPAIDDAIARSDEADFDGALRAFERAESLEDLTLDDLASLYAHRAAVHLAIGNAGEARADLRRLVAIQPGYELDTSASPALRDALDGVRATEPLTIAVRTESSHGATRFRAVVSHDPGALVRRVRLVVRSIGEGAWIEASASTYETSGTAFEYFAEAIGPGGVVVAREGSERAPSRVGEVPRAAIATVSPSTGEDTTIWWVIGGAGLAVVVAAVVVGAVVASSGPSDQTAFGPPMLRVP